MAQGVHRAQLERLRDHLREERRKAVQNLRTTRISMKNFTLTRFIALQRAFEAVEHAIRDASVGNVLLMDALGTRDWDFLDGFLTQLADAGSKGGKVDGRTLNFMLSVVKGVKPRDQVEALLAAQMAAVHTAMMTFAWRLAHVEAIPQQDSAERAFNKLGRTFAAQMEALKRYRSRGDQTVRVEHVTVNEGGQAIVGNVRHGGGDRDEGG